jgi:DNA-binding transcriptional ArsR family regulator
MGVKHADLAPGRNPAKKRTRLLEDAPTYPTNHRVRHEVLIILHEGEFSAAEIARMIGEDPRHVTNHLRDLYDAGAIEFVGYQGEGNFKRAVYRAIARPFMGSEDYQAMSVDERHETIGVYLQWHWGEALGSYRKKKMAQDDDLCVLSDDPWLDAEGRRELDDFLAASWSGDTETLVKLKGVQDIEARSAERMSKSGETGTKVVVSLLAFERAFQPIGEDSSRLPISNS